eukprot:TRINITY_DN4761_c0_g1_i1.p1 TRINITY_DN4761_c0_g1~~TRINITY_DN4761_c0_g1_i1.p1  ORF type:complete len:264 (-),score=92.84 TRINITY_DN4761_c0_g1_i1:337-1128(-)
MKEMIGLFSMNFSHYLPASTRHSEAIQNKAKNNECQISLKQEDASDYHRKSNGLVECMGYNKSSESVLCVRSRKSQDVKHSQTPVNLLKHQKRFVFAESGRAEEQTVTEKKPGRAKWDQEMERILTVVREHKEKATAEYNKSKINPRRNGSANKCITPKVTEQVYGIVNEHGKDDTMKSLIHQVEEDRKQRMQRRCEYGKKSSGLVSAHKGRNGILGLRTNTGKNEQRVRDEDGMWSEAIVSEYKAKLEKLNKMKKVGVGVTC